MELVAAWPNTPEAREEATRIYHEWKATAAKALAERTEPHPWEGLSDQEVTRRYREYIATFELA